MLVAVYSPHGTYDARFLANYAFINLVDPITRSPGIGQVQVFGAGQYAMRLWVKPDQLAKLGITVTGDRQRRPVAKHGQPCRTSRRRTDSSGPAVRLCGPGAGPPGLTRRIRRDRGSRVAAGRRGAGQGCRPGRARSAGLLVAGRLNGKPSAIVAVYQLPGSNAVDAANGVKKLMAEMKNRFPSDMDYTLSLDSTRVRRRGHEGNHYYAADRDCAS